MRLIVLGELIAWSVAFVVGLGLALLGGVIGTGRSIQAEPSSREGYLDGLRQDGAPFGVTVQDERDAARYFPDDD